MGKAVCRSVCAFVVAAAAGTPAWGAGEAEVNEPAGRLPNPTFKTPDSGAGLPNPSMTAPDAVSDEAPMQESDSEDAWESYSSLETMDGVAEDVTGGVRVEDIVEPPADYHYAAFDKSDPFIPPVVSKEEDDVDAVEVPIVSPLQEHSLTALEVVGIWQVKSGVRKAMIMTPRQQGIVVKKGDPIGNQGGKVMGIGDKYVMVREFRLTPDGTRKYDDKQLFMGDDPDRGDDGKIRFEPGAERGMTVSGNRGRSGTGGNGPQGILAQGFQRAERERAEQNRRAKNARLEKQQGRVQVESGGGTMSRARYADAPADTTGGGAPRTDAEAAAKTPAAEDDAAAREKTEATADEAETTRASEEAVAEREDPSAEGGEETGTTEGAATDEDAGDNATTTEEAADEDAA